MDREISFFNFNTRGGGLEWMCNRILENYIFLFQGQPVLSVVSASSVHLNEKDKWGPEQALTELSTTSTNFWHSAEGDINPTITFKLQKEHEILSIVVDDRHDCCHERFQKVEVRIGTTTSFNEATTCGIQSYAGQNKYK